MVRRALHYVLKLTERKGTIQFYEQILGMKVLRHEEFGKGCEATCNGPYDGKWSKTMMGYGAEDECFVLELVYNYGLKNYELANDLHKITLRSSEIKERVMQQELEFTATPDGAALITAPSNPGYTFEIYDGNTEDALQKVTLGSSNLQLTTDMRNDCANHDVKFKVAKGDMFSRSNAQALRAIQKKALELDVCYEKVIKQGSPAPNQRSSVIQSNLPHITQKDFWHGILGMNIVERNDFRLTLDYHDSAKFQLEFVYDANGITHKSAEGRIAFSCPTEELPQVQKSVESAGFTVKTPLISLDTPGKAAVQVVILLDPDMHEICFVGDEAFRQLSQIDPLASQSLAKAMEEDKSDEWFAKGGNTKK